MLSLRLRWKDESGFTLIELLGVAVILIILALMALPVYAEVSDRTREAKTHEQLRIIEQALEAHRADPQYANYPGSLQLLVTRGFLKPTSFETPWSSADNRVYYYYAVDRTPAATKFVLGDPGPGVACSLTSPAPPCGRNNGDAWVDPNVVAPQLKYVRRSH
ncbi:MAG TPA: type II secretion system protein [Symbiobacteriaceae bacterium]|nr:type II secretion system protein [Symbiobacteriaceae bacterium]